MRNSVIIKHEKYGLRILLSQDTEWTELLSDVRDKFSASAGFFGEASLTLTFSGRKLTEQEEDDVLSVISEVTKIRILCVFVEDEERNGVFLRAADLYRRDAERAERAAAAAAADQLETLMRDIRDQEEDPGESRYQMLLRSLRDGDIYRTGRTVIVLGDIEEGAALTTGRDAIVLGSVRGVIRAGEDRTDTGRHFVAASDLRPKKLSIDGITFRSKGRLFSRSTPAAAAVKNGEIVFVPFDGNLEELFL